MRKADSRDRARASRGAPTVLLTGFERFGGERINPSWDVAKLFDGQRLGSTQIHAVVIPVNYSRAIAALRAAIEKIAPVAILGLGQAGGRPALSLERVAINLVDGHARDGSGVGHGSEKRVVRGGPDAYFSRLPLARILSELRRSKVPAGFSLTAGAFICNAVMYAALHQMRQTPLIPVGFIHLPYVTDQSARHPSAPTMSLETMERGIAIALKVIAQAVKLQASAQ